MLINVKSALYVLLCFISIGVQTKRLKISSGLVWSNCGLPTDPIKLTYVDVTPFPLNIPGIETISAVVQLSGNVSSPVEASVILKKHSFLGWIEIPCVDNIGSCHYTDLCGLSPYNETCPTAFEKLKLPCACPVNEGIYSVKKYPINIAKVGPHWLEHGMYKGQVTVTSNSVELGCFAFQVALK